MSKFGREKDFLLSKEGNVMGRKGGIDLKVKSRNLLGEGPGGGDNTTSFES